MAFKRNAELKTLQNYYGRDENQIVVLYGDRFSGIVIEATRGELQAVAGNILYKEVEVTPLKEGNGTGCDMWENELLNGLVKRLLAVDARVRADKASRKYTRAEVLAMLDEIDPSSKTESEASNG